MGDLDLPNFLFTYLGIIFTVASAAPNGSKPGRYAWTRICF